MPSPAFLGPPRLGIEGPHLLAGGRIKGNDDAERRHRVQHAAYLDGGTLVRPQPHSGRFVLEDVVLVRAPPPYHPNLLHIGAVDLIKGRELGIAGVDAVVTPFEWSVCADSGRVDEDGRDTEDGRRESSDSLYAGCAV